MQVYRTAVVCMNETRLNIKGQSASKMTITVQRGYGSELYNGEITLEIMSGNSKYDFYAFTEIVLWVSGLSLAPENHFNTWTS